MVVPTAENALEHLQLSSPGTIMASQGAKPQILIIGIGTEFRGDDEAGLHVVRMLRAADLPPSIAVIETTGDGASLMAMWKGVAQVVLVDAITAGLPTGSVIRIDGRRELLASNLFATSSHSFGVAQALAISLAFDELPPTITLFGIQAGQFRIGAALSPEVQKSVRQTSDLLQREVTAAAGVEQLSAPLVDR